MPKTTLTQEIAIQLDALWKLSGEDTLTDAEIAERIGITDGQLHGWLYRKRPPKVQLKDGGPKETLRTIRTRAKATAKSGYLQKLYSIATQAETAGDFRTAANTFQWLLEKMFPLQFGSRLNLSGKIKTNTDINDLTDEELQEQISEQIEKLMMRPECQKVLKQFIPSQDG